MYNYVDCSYLQILIQYGVLFLLAVMVLYTIGMIRAYKANDFWMITLFTIICVYSITALTIAFSGRRKIIGILGEAVWHLVIVRNMLKSGEDVFLDDMTVDRLSESISKPVRITECGGDAFFNGLTRDKNE